MNDIDIRLTAKSSRKTRVHTGQLPPLPIGARVTSPSRRAISDNSDLELNPVRGLEKKHNYSETNLRSTVARRQASENLSRPAGGRSQEQHQLMKDDDEINFRQLLSMKTTMVSLGLQMVDYLRVEEHGIGIIKQR